MSFAVSLLPSVTTVFAAGATERLTVRAVDWPSPTVTLGGTLIVPTFCTETLAVAFGTFSAVAAAAVIVAAPTATPVTGTFTVVAPARMVTFAGIVTIPAGLTVRFNAKPLAGAWAESVRVRSCVAVPVIDNG